MAQKNNQAFSMFNGRLDNDAVRVNPGDLVRMYFVNVGPGVSSTHVIGTILDRVYDGKDPVSGVQTYAIPAGNGAMLEFYIPEEGVYPFVDHDKLAFLSYGLARCRRVRGPSFGTVRAMRSLRPPGKSPNPGKSDRKIMIASGMTND